MQINYILKYFTVWLDGYGLMGEGHTCKLPQFDLEFEDLRAGGMDFPIPIDLGAKKSMECNFKLYSFNPDVIKRWGLLDGQSTRLTFRAHLEGTSGQSDAFKAVMDAHPDKMGFGEWKPGQHPENEYNCKLSYYRLEMNGEKLIEIDPLNFIRYSNGRNQLQSAAINLGVL